MLTSKQLMPPIKIYEALQQRNATDDSDDEGDGGQRVQCAQQ